MNGTGVHCQGLPLKKQDTGWQPKFPAMLHHWKHNIYYVTTTSISPGSTSLFDPFDYYTEVQLSYHDPIDRYSVFSRVHNDPDDHCRAVSNPLERGLMLIGIATK